MKKNEKLKKGETKEMRKQNLNKGSHTSHFPHHTSSEGITLIALVITIIVMLILVAVSVSAAINGGLFGYAKNAVDETDSAKDAEQSLAGGQVTIGNKTYETIDEYLNSNELNWEAILAEANANPDAYKHPEQLVSTYIAIGTDGEPVNMDYWNPSKNLDGTFSLNGSNTGGYGYKKIYLEGCEENGGRIKGTVPQYIYNTELGTFKEVVNMDYTFFYHDDLVYAPEIPDTVTSMYYTFGHCTNLLEAPSIPDGIKTVYLTFAHCKSLAKAPIIPFGVTNLPSTFYNCTGLTEAPEIPSSVTDMNGTFSGCKSLTGTITINANPTSYSSCFYGTVKPITLTASSTETETATATTLNNLKGTANNGNVSIAE